MIAVLSRCSLLKGLRDINRVILSKYSNLNYLNIRSFLFNTSTRNPIFKIPKSTLIMASAIDFKIDLQALGQNSVKAMPSKELVKLESLWKDSTTVIIFLRRFGCVFCRQSAMEISKILPLLEQHTVRLFAVGLEEFGYEEFAEGNYFKGDLFIDIDEASYKQIGYKKYGTIGVLMSLFNKTARDAIAKSRSEGTPGNLKGNGLQTGGVLILSGGGTKILMDYRQDNPADHVANSEILRVLGISESQVEDAVSDVN